MRDAGFRGRHPEVRRHHRQVEGVEQEAAAEAQEAAVAEVAETAAPAVLQPAEDEEHPVRRQQPHRRKERAVGLEFPGFHGNQRQRGDHDERGKHPAAAESVPRDSREPGSSRRPPAHESGPEQRDGGGENQQVIEEPQVNQIHDAARRSGRRRGSGGTGRREDPGNRGQWEEQDPAAGQRNADPVQAMAEERARSAPCDQERREESGHREERRHPEAVDEADQPAEPDARLPVLVGPPAGRQFRDVAEGGVQDEPEQHHHGAQRVQRVDPRRGRTRRAVGRRWFFRHPGPQSVSPGGRGPAGRRSPATRPPRWRPR